MRSKEEAHDYRYFPEPDLPPLIVSEQFVQEVKQAMPELPENRRKRFGEQYGLSYADASQLVSERALADYYEAAAEASAILVLNSKLDQIRVVARARSNGLSAAESPVRQRNWALLFV
jgi:aspartyl-tRNA(Asn)/glutamyl-tRNA(Gln) amidotransferase subunit B